MTDFNLSKSQPLEPSDNVASVQSLVANNPRWQPPEVNPPSTPPTHPPTHPPHTHLHTRARAHENTHTRAHRVHHHHSAAPNARPGPLAVALCGHRFCHPGNRACANAVLCYRPVQVIREQRYTKASDVYAFGLILWEASGHAQGRSSRRLCAVKSVTRQGGWRCEKLSFPTRTLTLHLATQMIQSLHSFQNRPAAADLGASLQGAQQLPGKGASVAVRLSSTRLCSTAPATRLARRCPVLRLPGGDGWALP